MDLLDPGLWPHADFMSFILKPRFLRGGRESLLQQSDMDPRAVSSLYMRSGDGGL